MIASPPRGRPWRAGLLLACIPAGAGIAQEPVADDAPAVLQRRIDLARQRIYPALVNIRVVARSFSGGRTVRSVRAGSGTIISREGHVLTNHHVAEDATSIVCTLTSGEEIPADPVGGDAATDLSVLALRLGERPADAPPIAFARLGDSERVEVGDHVLAMGNPLSLSSSMTLGIVSNTRRVLSGAANQLIELDLGASQLGGRFTLWIQHDALILPGNSGGPLVSLQGEVIGVNTRAGSGYGFATPANLTRWVVDQILAHGEVRRGWIGASFMPVGKLDRDSGALVSSVVPTSPAARAGLQPGDVLLALGDLRPRVRFLEQVPLFYADVAGLAAGSLIEIGFLRGDTVRQGSIHVEPMEPLHGEEVEVRRLGLTIREVTGPMALARGLVDDRGVRVTGLRQGQAFEAARPQIRPGDIVLEIAGEPVDTAEDFRTAVEAAGEGEVPVVFRREREYLVTMVDLTEKDEPRRGGELAKAWLGVRTQVLTQKVAAALEVGDRTGFRITQVFPGTRAAAAELRAGDLLLAVDGDALRASRPQDERDLRNLIEDMAIGEEVELDILRRTGDGWTAESIVVELEESPASSTDAKKLEDEVFEFAVRELTFMDRVEWRLGEQEGGLLVTEVRPGGWASLADMRSGLLLLRVAGTPVTTVDGLETVLARVRRDRPAAIPVLVRKDTNTLFLFLEPDWSQIARPEAEDGSQRDR